MFDEKNEISLGILNNIIWRLHQNGEAGSAKLIERERDKQAMEEYDKKEAARQEREKAYKQIEAEYAKLKRWGDEGKTDSLTVINSIMGLGSLHKVYFIFVSNPLRLKQIETIKELYDRVTYAYLYTFEGWREYNRVFDAQSIGQIRALSSTVERCIRFIKEDKPEIFNLSLVNKSKAQCEDATESFGNSAVGLE
jgi:hypothetical protein